MSLCQSLDSSSLGISFDFHISQDDFCGAFNTWGLGGEIKKFPTALTESKPELHFFQLQHRNISTENCLQAHFTLKMEELRCSFLEWWSLKKILDVPRPKQKMLG